MSPAGRLALWLAVVFAAWSLAGAGAALGRSRADIGRAAERGLAAASLSATAALGVMIAALVTHDFGVRFVAARSSVLMPLRYLPNAVLGAPAGALLAFAVATGLLSLLAVRRAGGPRERAWVTTCAAGLVLIALLTSASEAPFARTYGYRADGAVLSPDLQRGNAVLMSVALYAGTVSAAVAFIVTTGALAAGALGARWSRDVRRWNAVAWSCFFVGTVASARWHAFNPLRGGWLASPATQLWLLPCAIGAWLVHLDGVRSTNQRTVTRLLLVAATFIAAAGAVSLGGGAFVHGLADATSPGGRWFGAAALAALALTVATVRSAKGVLGGDSATGDAPARARVAGFVAHAGFVVVLGAAVGSHYARGYTTRLADTEIFRARDPFGHQWSFTSEGASTAEREDYAAVSYALRPTRDGITRRVVVTDARSYGLAGQDSAGVAAFTADLMRGFLVETRVGIEDPSLTPPAIRIAFVPFGSWLVPGAILVVVGTLLPLAGVDSRAAG